MKRIVKTLVFTILAIGLTGCFAKKNTHGNGYANTSAKPKVVSKADAYAEYATNNARADAVVDYAMNYVGTPYRYGGDGPNSFDCSGFTCYVFGNFGITLSRVSADQLADGQKISNPRKLRRGDLVFFKGSNLRNNKIGHVGVVTEADNATGEFSFIHVSSSVGVTVSKSTEEYYKKRYVTGCRVIF